jgi:phage terminase large subunit-like protein
MAGRAWGKTRTGAEWLAYEARTHPSRDFGVIGRTIEQTREVCMEGESGLLQALGLSIISKEYNRSTQEIRLANGAKIYAYTAENPDSMRGPNLSGAWCDELATWHYEQAWHEGLIPATRIGNPRIVITTTPRRTKLLKGLVERDDGTVAMTRGSIDDNAINLSEEALVELHRRYDGTRLGRQELGGEFLEDVPGALWTASVIEQTRGVLID